MKKLIMFGLMMVLLISLAQALTLTASPTTATAQEDETITVTLNAGASSTFTKNVTFGSLSGGPATSAQFTFSPGVDTTSGSRTYSILFSAVNAANQNDTNQVVVTLTFTDREGLRLTDLDFDVGSEDDDNLQDASDGASISDAKPGDKFTVRAEVENVFDNDADIEIRDITMTVTIEGIDDGDDLDDETDEVDVNAGRNKDLTLNFDLPDRLDTDDFDVVVEIDGRDELGVNYHIEKRFVMGVDKESHDLQVESFSLRPTALSCTRKGTLEVQLVNLGDEDEEEVRFIATNDDLDIDFEEFDDGNIDMGTGTDDDAEYMVSVPIDASKAKPGTYTVQLAVYRDTSRLEDTATADVVVQACTQGTVDEPDFEEPDVTVSEPEEPDVVVAPTQPTAPVNSGSAPVYAQVSDNSTMYMVLLGAGAFVLLVLIVGILALLFRK